MVPPLLFDISQIDLEQVQIDAHGVEQVNPHRGAMRMLDGLIWFDNLRDSGYAVAYKDIGNNEFWVPGHIPGRPIFPGVLMIEAGAQLASFMILSHLGGSKFVGFVGCDKVKFRGQVAPGDRLILLGQGQSIKPRRSICSIQGLVKGSLVFEASITGMPI